MITQKTYPMIVWVAGIVCIALWFYFWGGKQIMQQPEHTAPDQLSPQVVEQLLQPETVVEAKRLDIDLIEQPVGEAAELPYKQLAEHVRDHQEKKSPVHEVVPDEGQERIFHIETINNAQQPVGWVEVFLRGGYLWTTDANGSLMVTKRLPDSYEYLYFQFQKVWFIPWFVKQNISAYAWTDIPIVAKIDQWITKTIPTSSKTLAVQDEKIGMELVDATWCALEKWDGSCYEGEVAVTYNFVEPTMLDTLSIPMTAVVNGQVGSLMSNGMAFVSFYDDAGEKLQHTGKATKICYTLTPEQITQRKATSKGAEEKDGYRWFDAWSWLWKFDEEAVIEINETSFCATTKHIY